MSITDSMKHYIRLRSGRMLALAAKALLAGIVIVASSGEIAAQGAGSGSPVSLPTPKFKYGDIYLASVSLPNPGDPYGGCPSLSSSGYGIVRLDPSGGA